MRNQIFYYKNHNFQWKSLALKNLNFNKYELNNKTKLNLSILLPNIKKKDYMNIILAIYFLESICTKRPFVEKKDNKVKYKKTDSTFKIKVTLRTFYIDLFILFFKEFVLTFIKKNESIKLNYSINIFGNLLLNIKDLSWFPGLDEDVLYWKHLLKIDYVYNNNNKEKTQFFFEQLGFLLKNEQK